MIHHAAAMPNLPFKITEALYGCFVLVTSHQQCTSIARDLGRTIESNALAITLTGMILNGPSVVNTT